MKEGGGGTHVLSALEGGKRRGGKGRKWRSVHLGGEVGRGGWREMVRESCADTLAHVTETNDREPVFPVGQISG